MLSEPYVWPPHAAFINRREDLAALENWWENPTRDALALVGRRRVGKSWLFRRFAHGKHAVLLVTDKRLLTTQMRRFSGQLEEDLRVRPTIDSVAEFIRILYELGQDRKILAVIDEFPFLLPEGVARDEVLSEVQAVMEDHRDTSQTKLLLCGSLIGQMESLLHVDSPLHGRLRRLDTRPLTFAESGALMTSSDSPEERITRYAVAGGMARYLSDLGHGDLREQVCRHVLNPRGALFDDPRAVLEQELRNAATYFSVLETLAEAPAGTNHLTQSLGIASSRLSPYIETLREMRLTASALPVGAAVTARAHKHYITDGFIRFWFRFVFPNQQALQDGLSPEALWESSIEPCLADFVSPTFEELCARYVRRVYGASAPKVGSWWGKALNVHRKDKSRLSEEIDVVAARARHLRIVGECKWTTAAMPADVLNDLLTFKVPAIAQDGHLKVPSTGQEVLLFSRSGFAPGLHDRAAADDRLTLVTLSELVAELDAEADQRTNT